MLNHMPRAYSYKVTELRSKPIRSNSKVCAPIHYANVIHLSGPLSLHFVFQMGKRFHFIEGRTVDQKV